MGSKVISFRVDDDLYKEFDRKCNEEEVSPAIKLRELVDSAYHERIKEQDAKQEAQVKVIKVEGEMADKVKGTKSDTKPSWFPLDFSPLFGKD